MKTFDFYDSISSLTLECTCEGIGINKWDKLMKNSVRADKYKIHKLLKVLCPENFNVLGFDLKPLKELGWFNPYNYYKTRDHIIVVHSSIEYFFKIN